MVPAPPATPFYVAPIPPAGPIGYPAYPYFPGALITDPNTGMTAYGVPGGY